MKCQQCGQNEVNFYYSSNVNGAVTETHLCSKCASGAGADIVGLFDFRSMFEDFAPMFNMNRYFLPATRRVMPKPPVLTASATCQCCKKEVMDDGVKADEKMKELRELNMQMRIAVENEEFEKAAELRDKIKELNN